MLKRRQVGETNLPPFDVTHSNVPKVSLKNLVVPLKPSGQCSNLMQADSKKDKLI
jgi:hypothetical protein